MGSKSSGEDNLLYEREQSKDFRITDSTSSNENIRKDSEIWKIAGKINAEHFLTVGTILRFPTAKLNHLKDIYPNQPQQRLYILLQKWCEIVERKYGHHHDHRRLLAKLLSEADYKIISDDMNVDISDVITPEQLTDVLCDVCFDTLNPNESRSARPDQAEVWNDAESTEMHSYVSRKRHMLNMLKKLKLVEFHPSKISLPKINEIIRNSTDEEITEESIPWLLLRNFMNLNYKGREDDLNTLYECDEDENDDEMYEETNIRLHPLDVFLITFLCCDQILQQELVSKMFFCRVAVPFIYRTLEDKLVMSKWAFQKIVIKRKRNEKWVEDDPLSQFVKTVSIIRVGSHVTVSKSNMINEIISNDKHSSFFNKKICKFETKKLITNGMIEASWFLPSDPATDISNDLVMFLNLRGDSLKHEEEVRILYSVSDVIIVHIHASNLTKSDIIKHFETIHSFDKLIIYAVEFRKRDSKNKAKFDFFKKQLKLKNNKANCIQVEDESSQTFVSRLRRYISDFLMKIKAKLFSEEISNIKFGDDNFSVDGFQMAKDIVDLMDTKHIQDECQLFPLQGEIYRKICMFRKEIFRSTSIDEHQQLETYKKKAQKEQSDLFKESWILQQFAYSKLNKCNEKDSRKEHLFFIAWMKLFMDKRFRKYKQKHVKFAPCYERLIREMGQAFLIKNKFFQEKTDGWDVGIFPSFVSNMLQFGFPFELMDGETSMVPLPWVIAVLRQLKKDIGDQKFIYVISVLGIQSSGKSTLLNTMFGLHFAVSAGRCTRGVFMQLIKVTDDTLPFHYLLILDTEGINASTNDENLCFFENQLATFAIGLGNITILNIKGENTSEMENFLQIAVYACLKLKMANKNIKMEQRCVFVHQNVDANDAYDRLQEDRDKLMLRLDERVKDAAHIEDRSDISSFNQVIGINPESDVWYFPNLWRGVPPMATVEIGYSKKVALLKHHILHKVAKSHGTSYSITDTIIRIEDFCRGILRENFVFGFRNSLEIKVYRQMEFYFQSITWEIECDADEFIYNKVRQRIACTEREHIEHVCEKYTEELRNILTEKFSLTENMFKNFVNTHKMKNLMEQYTERRILEIQQMKDVLILKKTHEIQQLKACHKSSLKQLAERTWHTKELREKAQSHVANYKENELSDEDTNTLFEKIWNNWLQGIKSINDENPDRVEKIIDKILIDMFTAEKSMLHEEIKKNKKFRDDYRTMDKLMNCVGLYQLQDDHITWASSSGDDQPKDLVMMKYQKNARSTIEIIMKKIDNYISTLQKEYCQFKESYVIKVFRILIDSLDSHNSNHNNTFSMTKALRAKLAVHIKMYIVEVFTCLNNDWREKNDVKKQLQSEKQKYLSDFISLVEKKTIEARMAQLFARNIERFIIETVSHKLQHNIVTQIIHTTFTTKYDLMIGIMKDLVNKSDFNEFMQYVDDSSSYALDWLTTDMNKRIFTKNGQNNEYTRFAEMHINEICMNIKQIMSSMVMKTSDDKKTHISKWCSKFEKHLTKYYTVTKGTFLTDIDDEIVDVCNFTKLTLNEFEIVDQKIKNRFKSEVAENVKWTDSPYQRVFNRLWGCIAKCPFCKEICQKRATHIGEPHSCIQHRPPAVIGIRQTRTKMMAWMCCNRLVSTDKTFRCNAIDTEFRCQSSGKDGVDCLHQYRTYKKVIQDWTIRPYSLAEPPKYWSWFISTFQKQLCEKYNYKVYEHQDTWPKITAKDAIESLALHQ